ncbi:MAG: hypothetical protein OJF49_002117 [Ktedonobacterales bacterium]|nr:MAG: hypothetical protein OJF49_002117 [Ktedonobacterales bacterium]
MPQFGTTIIAALMTCQYVATFAPKRTHRAHGMREQGTRPVPSLTA